MKLTCRQKIRMDGNRLFPVVLVLSFFVLFAFPNDHAAAKNESGRYDVSYLWTSDLDGLLDYKEDVERILGPTVGARLRVVGRDGRYGLVYDRDGDTDSSSWVARRHTELLGRFGLEPAASIKDDGYFDLYNVCYGLGPNLEALQKHYSFIYRYLGQDVGKNLFIEKTGSGNYTLIYRRRGDRKSTATVARRHARLLARKRISATIIRENNNEVVFGESSLLDSEEQHEEDSPPPVRPPQSASGPRLLVPEALKQCRSKQRKSTVMSIGAVSGSSPLEERLERYIKQLRRKGRIAGDESTGWLVYDLTSRTSLVDINVDQSF